jgi:hypothetical protein
VVGYKNPDRSALWTAAKNAAKAVIDLGSCELADWGAPDQQAVAKNRFDFFKAYTSQIMKLSGEKCLSLISVRAHRVNRLNGPMALITSEGMDLFKVWLIQYEMMMVKILRSFQCKQ